MDEVHYLADRFRGAVWEEVIIHLPAVGHPGLAVGDGLQRRGVRRLAGHRARRDRGGGQRAPAGAAVAAHAGRQADVRPVPRRRRGPQARRAPRAAALHPGDCCAGWSSSDGRSAGPGGGRRGPRWRGPMRPDIVDRLDREGLLPAILFIFSRAGCDAAVQQCLAAGLRLTYAGRAGRDPPGRRVPGHRASPART